MIVTLTTIMDSHECPEYRAGRYCARIAQVFSKKKTTKYCDLRLVGQVLSPNGEDLKARNMSGDLKKYLVHSQQGLKTRNLRSLPWSRSHQMGMPLCMDNIKMLCLDHICRGGEKGFEGGRAPLVAKSTLSKLKKNCIKHFVK